METIIVDYHKRPKLDKPILIEGLPGVGNIGKLAADHIANELDTVHFATIFSKHFPPQVLIDDDGIIRMVSNELHYYKNPSGKDLILLTGDYQGMTPEGQYEISHKMVEIAEEFSACCIYTLGGYHAGKMIETPRVLGASTTKKEVKYVINSE